MIKKICVPECYKQFHCIDVECSDSCCAGWQVDVDAQAYEEYKKVTGEFGDYIRSVMIEEGDCGGERAQFRLREDGRCPFLLENGLCDMYANLGEDSLCHTCTNFPRYMEDYGELREMGIGFSCPEASRLMLSTEQKMEYVEMVLDKNLMLDTKESENTKEANNILDNGEMLKRQTEWDLNQIHLVKADTLTGGRKDCTEWEAVAQDVMKRTRRKDLLNEQDTDAEKEIFQKSYFAVLHTCRNTAFAIVTNRELTIAQRVLLYMDYAVCLQDILDHAQIAENADFAGKEEQDNTSYQTLLITLAEQYKDTAFLKKRCQTLKSEVDALPADAL